MKKILHQKNISFAFAMLLLGALFFSSCEETIQLDPEQAEPVLVVEGLITNSFRQQEIRLTKTAPFGSTATPRVSGARVQVTDSKGAIFDFEELEPGLYLSNEPFAGKAGLTYNLEVEVDGNIYNASETMLPVTKVDSLVPVIDEEEMQDPDDEGRFYEVLFYAREPQETEDFYLFRFFRNDTIENFEGTVVFAYDDLALGEDINGVPFPVYYAKGDTAAVEMYSLTRQAFRFYFELGANINNDGGMFSGQPANVTTNLEGGAIGYFQVSSMDRAEVVVDPE